jgi:hypothetical protein
MHRCASLIRFLKRVQAILLGKSPLSAQRDLPLKAGSERAPLLSADEIGELGFDWPKYALVEKHRVIEDGKVDLVATIEHLQSSRAFYRKQLNDAYAFKMQTGADYADFTDRRDDYARMERELGAAIAYLTGIVEAAEA